jgi:hypothetical protein
MLMALALRAVDCRLVVSAVALREPELSADLGLLVAGRIPLKK